MTFTPTLKLGAGGMAEVHLAKMSGPSGDGWVALKRIRDELREEPELRERFEREARIGARLRHPNVVSLLAWGVDRHGPYIAFEYLVGRSAGALLKAQTQRGSALPLEVALCIGRDVAAALAYAHGFEDAELGSGGVIHRDVSLENVLVGYDGTAKLTDFGIARLAGRQTRLTQAQTLKGKLGYLAPELFDGHPGDVRSDVFAYGVTLYKLVCGVAPFQGQTDAELMRAVFAQEPLAPRQVRAGLPEALDGLLLACLAREREQRPPSMDEVLRVVEGALAVPLETARERVRAQMVALFPMEEDPLVRTTRGAAARPATQTVPVEPAARSRRWLLRAAAATAAAAGLGGLVSTLGGREGVDDAGEEPASATPSTAATAAPDGGDSSASDAGSGVVSGVAPPGDVEKDVVAHPGVPDAGGAPARSRVRPSRPTAGSRAQAQKGARSTLVIRVRPWAQVFVDGDLVGTTPLPPLPLAPGPHSVILVNSERNVRRHFTVKLAPGETKRLNVTLEPSGPTR